MGDLLFVVVDLAIGEEILLADAQGELANGIAEAQREIPVEILQGVDSESIDVVRRDQILEAADQDVAELVIRGQELLERGEVADGLRAAWARRSLPPEERIAPKFIGIDRGILRRIDDVFGNGPVVARVAFFVAPVDRRICSFAERSLRSCRVREHVAAMVEDDIEDDVHISGVCVIDEATQLIRCMDRVGSQSALDVEKILDAVSMIGSLVGIAVQERAVLEHRREPYRAHAESFQVIEPLTDTLDRSTLKSTERAVEGGLRRRC